MPYLLDPTLAPTIVTSTLPDAAPLPLTSPDACHASIDTPHVTDPAAHALVIDTARLLGPPATITLATLVSDSHFVASAALPPIRPC